MKAHGAFLIPEISNLNCSICQTFKKYSKSSTLSKTVVSISLIFIIIPCKIVLIHFICATVKKIVTFSHQFWLNSVLQWLIILSVFNNNTFWDKSCLYLFTCQKNWNRMICSMLETEKINVHFILSFFFLEGEILMKWSKKGVNCQKIKKS